MKKRHHSRREFVGLTGSAVAGLAGIMPWLEGPAWAQTPAPGANSTDPDLVVFNDVGEPGIGFDSAENEVVLVGRDSERRLPRASKAAIAVEILDEVERLL